MWRYPTSGSFLGTSGILVVYLTYVSGFVDWSCVYDVSSTLFVAVVLGLWTLSIHKYKMSPLWMKSVRHCSGSCDARGESGVVKALPPSRSSPSHPSS